ncbi:cyclophilin-like domain-containing protein [Cantharellus anzutake]|uniref:cyclophilin-like domain-containing protein n=1 Tax=Cantharellus anzutake TaxID=1750568 RepID=UPI001907A5EF|nr:cyclophilin-like domain-containing protein [Cantharellus anzutake]KAF8313512.1 cyclophilin-like domain-containing protein [Cantharellus anzutake]
MVNPRVFFDFAVESESIGRVVFELFSNIVPRTCENFRALATGERGVLPVSQIPLSYKGSIIHRSVPGFMIQGGDFVKKNGSGGVSIYGGTFEDENLDLDVDREGLLVMANKGPSTNGSQFFITLRSCPHLNGKHVVFGRVVTGYEIVKKIAEIPTDAKDRPLRPIIISGAGELVLRKKVAPPENINLVGSSRSKKRPRSHSPAISPPHSRSRSTSHSPSPSPRKDEGDGRQARCADSGHSLSRSPSWERRKEPSRRERAPKTTKWNGDPFRNNGTKSKGTGLPGRSSKTQLAETEAELDARIRLEREEMERVAEAKKKDAEVLRDSLKRSRIQESLGGVRFKGRGTMRYRDPELFRR